QKGQQAATRLNSDNVEAIQIDVSDEASINTARATLGEKTDVLDVLINNAGIRGVFPQLPSSVNVNEIRRVYNTNLFGAIEVTQTFLDLLKKSEAPRIVNVTSGLASLTLHSDPTWKYYPVKGAAY